MLEPNTGLSMAGSQDSSTPPRPPRTQCRPQFEGDDAPLRPQRPVDFANKMSIADFDVQMGLLGPKLQFCSESDSHGLMLTSKYPDPNLDLCP